MAHPASEYHRGEMNVSDQVATYALVMSFTKWGSLIIAASVLFLTLLFCTGTGFLGSAAVAVVVMALGILVLRGGGGH